MRLTRYTDYALRVLIYLALHADRLCPIAEIADAYGISQNHLAKVAHDLAKEGFVVSGRGRFGGLRLARPAAEIGVGAIVRAMEGEDRLTDCAACAIAPACGLADAFDTALEAFVDSLDRVTLADVSRRRAALRCLLHPA